MMSPEDLSTGTIGAAHSDNSAGGMTPSLCRRSSSSSTFARSASGTGRGLQYRGCTDSSIFNLAVTPFSLPSPAVKTGLYGSINVSCPIQT